MGTIAAALLEAWRSRWGRVGAILLLLIVAAAIAGPWLLPDPRAQPDIVGAANLPPGVGHPFGTDRLSRDVLARTVSGARISLAVAALAVVLSATLGTAVGLVAAAFGGLTDTLLMRVVDATLAVPRLFVVLLVLAAAERVPIWALVLLIGGTGWFGTSRLVRAEALRLQGEGFVQAAYALGASRRRIILRHLLPNTLPPLLVAATLGVGDVILLEAGLSYLGLGIQPPSPSWGVMIMEAKDAFAIAPWAGAFPGMAIVLTVLAVNLFGEALRDATDPRRA